MCVSVIFNCTLPSFHSGLNEAFCSRVINPQGCFVALPLKSLFICYRVTLHCFHATRCTKRTWKESKRNPCRNSFIAHSIFKIIKTSLYVDLQRTFKNVRRQIPYKTETNLMKSTCRLHHTLPNNILGIFNLRQYIIIASCPCIKPKQHSFLYTSCSMCKINRSVSNPL